MHRTLTLATIVLSATALAPAPRHGAASVGDRLEEALPAPRFVNIVGACTSPNPRVAPPRITVNGDDAVEWRDPSGQADSFTIEPKEPGVWPFGAPRHAAGRGRAATSGRPSRRTVNGQNVQRGQVYSYKITILCPGGRVQVIDPDIIIGEI